MLKVKFKKLHPEAKEPFKKHVGDAGYDLFAVSIHTGSANYGHYTSYGLNTDGNWYKFDDQNVTMLWDKEKDQLTPVEQKVVTQYAYVLMYRRRDVDFD